MVPLQVTTQRGYKQYNCINNYINSLASANSKISLSKKSTTVTDENKEMKVCIGINSKYITDRTLPPSIIRMELILKKMDTIQ